MTLLLHLFSWLACLPLVLMYPMEDDGDPLIGRYRLQMEKKDISSPLKDSLLSALLMSEIHGEAQKQRKKAVDSTFIRFGRSSFPGNRRHSSQSSSSSGDSDQFPDGNSQLVDSERASELNIVRNEMSSSGEMEVIVPEVLQTYNHPSSGGGNFQIPPLNGCRLANSGDLVRALMGSTCNRILQKVKRENVNDTFIRFGKRETARQLRRAAAEDPQQHQET